MQEQKEGEALRSNRFSGSSVATEPSVAEVKKDLESVTLQPLNTRHVPPGSIVCSDTWRAYVGIASRGFVQRRVNHGEKKYSGITLMD